MPHIRGLGGHRYLSLSPQTLEFLQSALDVARFLLTEMTLVLKADKRVHAEKSFLPGLSPAQGVEIEYIYLHLYIGIGIYIYIQVLLLIRTRHYIRH